MINRPTEIFRTRAFLNRVKVGLVSKCGADMRVDGLRPQAILFGRFVDIHRDAIEGAWSGRTKRGFRRSTVERFEGVLGREQIAAMRVAVDLDPFLDACDFATMLATRARLPAMYQDVLVSRKDIYQRWSPDSLIGRQDAQGSSGIFRRLLMQLYEPNYHLRMLHYMYFLIGWLDVGSVQAWCKDVAVLAAIEWGRAQQDKARALEEYGRTYFHESHLYGDSELRSTLLDAFRALFFRERAGRHDLTHRFSESYNALCLPSAGGSQLQQLVGSTRIGAVMNERAAQGDGIIGYQLTAARSAFRRYLSEYGMVFADLDALLSESAWIDSRRSLSKNVRGQIWDSELSII